MERHFKLTILGAGTGVPLKNRHAPGLVVEGGKTLLLIDSGSGAAYQIARAGFKYYQFDHLLYSHYAHPDHINDLAELIFANAYFDPPRNRSLHIYGPQGIESFIEKLFNLYPVLGKAEFPIKTYELNQGKLIIEDITIETKPLDHQKHASIGYRIEYQGKSIIYSGDTDYCSALIELSQNGDVLVVECSFPDGYKVKGHLTPSEIGEIATRAGAKKVILTHLYPICDQFDVVSQVQEKFSGEVILAEDLMGMTV
jgi:ribonuclease BN (tRNA processing enzyme)